MTESVFKVFQSLEQQAETKKMWFNSVNNLHEDKIQRQTENWLKNSMGNWPPIQQELKA